MDRIRTNVSIDYHVRGYFQEQAEDRSVKLMFRVDNLELLEISSVCIQSDPSVGACRSTNQKPSHHRIEKIELQETVEQAEVIDPEVEALLENEAMKADRKRARETWEFSDRHQIPRDMVTQTIYENECSFTDFRGIILDYLGKQGTEYEVTVLEQAGLGMTPKEFEGFSIAKLFWA